MTVLVPIVMFGWAAVAIGLFVFLRPRHAVLAAFIIGWLFLPVEKFPISGFLDFTKVMATNVSVLIAVAFVDGRRLGAFRPRAIDVPMVVWCLCPLASAISNGLGVYDGLSDALKHIISWGIPYVIGRVYFRDRRSLKELAVAIVIGGLIYLPLCLFEVRMSPQLHYWIYGSHPTPFVMIKRYGGYRPMVFMDSSLMVGMWMASSTVIAFWLFHSRVIRRLLGLSSWAVVVPLMLTTLLCKTVGAATLMLAGIGLCYVTRATRSRMPLLALVIAGAMYIPIRMTGILAADPMLSAIESVYDPQRTRSFGVRLKNEDMLSEKALERPWFGWGGWYRGAVYNERGRPISIPDGLWVGTVGRYGLVGLTSLAAVFLLPSVVLVRQRSARRWVRREAGARAALTALTLLYWLDSLSNAFPHPILVLVIGGLCGFGARDGVRTGGPSAVAGSVPGIAPPATTTSAPPMHPGGRGP